jgi:hypothetical protein
MRMKSPLERVIGKLVSQHRQRSTTRTHDTQPDCRRMQRVPRDDDDAQLERNYGGSTGATSALHGFVERDAVAWHGPCSSRSPEGRIPRAWRVNEEMAA